MRGKMKKIQPLDDSENAAQELFWSHNVPELLSPECVSCVFGSAGDDPSGCVILCIRHKKPRETSYEHVCGDYVNKHTNLGYASQIAIFRAAKKLIDGIMKSTNKSHYDLAPQLETGDLGR